MTIDKAYIQFEQVVAWYEQWGATNVINFEEWLKMKGITINED